MRTKRAKVLIILSILLLALATSEITITSRLSSKNRSAFESLREGMTFEEASCALERDLNSDLQSSILPFDEYEYIERNGGFSLSMRFDSVSFLAD